MRKKVEGRKMEKKHAIFNIDNMKLKKKKIIVE